MRLRHQRRLRVFGTGWLQPPAVAETPIVSVELRNGESGRNSRELHVALEHVIARRRAHTAIVQIVAFPKDPEARRQAAELLVEAFPHENGWPTLALALEEVDEALAAERRCLAALDGDQLLGWITAIPNYRERVWELHPLVVRAGARNRGIGRALTRELERVVAAEGGLTMWVGSDDDLGVTNLAGVDLYPAPLDRLRELAFPASHQIGFYMRVGYAICGIVPDANGRGLHGILLARRLGADG